MVHYIRFSSFRAVALIVAIVLTYNLLGLSAVYSQGQITLDQYIELYKDIAMEEMRKHGIPASIKLGQGILESGFGNSKLARNANNHFGIKCHGWQGRTFYHDDDKQDECFRAYDDPKQSFRDHSEFLRTRARYAPLFELDIMDYKAWARGLQRAGYATNPRYAELLIGVIERNRLYRFDKMALEGVADDRQRRQEPRVPAQAENVPSDNNNLSADGIARDGRREVYVNNRIKYVYAVQGDTPERIADEMGIWTWEIYRYNEMSENQPLRPGQKVYLQPKRRQGSEFYHFVQHGETMYDISQIHGIKLRHLYRRNLLEEGTPLRLGQKLILRGRLRN